MSGTDVFQGDNYEVIAWANDQRIIYYAQFGSYQGEWFLVSRNQENYYIYKGSYGSCSGCDSFQGFFDYGDIDKAKACEFAKDYIPFLIVPRDTMGNVCVANKLMEIMPANIRDEYGEIDYDEAVGDTTIAVKIEENLNLTAQDILTARNAELKQRALKTMGYERFVAETKPVTLDKNGDNELLRIDDIVLAYVKDSSTPRRYLLRVPPTMKTVHEAIAWTFGLRPEQYHPEIET